MHPSSLVSIPGEVGLLVGEFFATQSDKYMPKVSGRKYPKHLWNHPNHYQKYHGAFEKSLHPANCFHLFFWLVLPHKNLRRTKKSILSNFGIFGANKMKIWDEFGGYAMDLNLYRKATKRHQQLSAEHLKPQCFGSRRGSLDLAWEEFFPCFFFWIS